MSEIQINTTQNVKINFRASGVGERLVAFLIDVAIKMGYLYFIDAFFDLYGDMDQWSEIAIDTLLSLPVVFYTLVLESVMGGQTVGKRVMKIKVVKIDGYQTTFSDYVVRWFFRIVDVYLLGLGFFIIIFSKNGQRLGDMASGTSVILLKDKVDMSHTILEELKSDYKPSYPTVIKLSDNDARIIKETFVNARKTKDYNTLIKLRTKIIEVAEIKNVKHDRDVDFIDTILKDYNYYTQSM